MSALMASVFDSSYSLTKKINLINGYFFIKLVDQIKKDEYLFKKIQLKDRLYKKEEDYELLQQQKQMQQKEETNIKRQ